MMRPVLGLLVAVSLDGLHLKHDIASDAANAMKLLGAFKTKVKDIDAARVNLVHTDEASIERLHSTQEKDKAAMLASSAKAEAQFNAIAKELSEAVKRQ